MSSSTPYGGVHKRMGANATKLASKSYNYFFGTEGSSSSTDVVINGGRYQLTANAFVYTKKSSLYFDEDGHLAHEFYCEVPSKVPGKMGKLKRIRAGLIPQGEVKLRIPRLHRDFPVVMYEA